MVTSQLLGVLLTMVKTKTFFHLNCTDTYENCHLDPCTSLIYRSYTYENGNCYVIYLVKSDSKDGDFLVRKVSVYQQKTFPIEALASTAACLEAKRSGIEVPHGAPPGTKCVMLSKMNGISPLLRNEFMVI